MSSPEGKTHEEILADPKVVRCLGVLDSHAVYEVESDYITPTGGVVLKVNGITKAVWRDAVDEILMREDRPDDCPIFLARWQAESLMSWAEDLFVEWPGKEKVPCTDCNASGWYVGLHDRRLCPTCDGNKVVNK